MVIVLSCLYLYSAMNIGQWCSMNILLKLVCCDLHLSKYSSILCFRSARLQYFSGVRFLRPVSYSSSSAVLALVRMNVSTSVDVWQRAGLWWPQVIFHIG